MTKHTQGRLVVGTVAKLTICDVSGKFLPLARVTTPNGAELLLQHAMLIIDEYRNQHITDSARIAKLESQLRAVTDDRDGWVKQCSDRIDDALEFAKESDARGEEIKAMKETLEKSMTPVAWYVTGTSRMQDKNDAKAEARRCGGTAEARPLYLHPNQNSVK